METKRFSMGSAKAIAEFYGGDKQKILQALQSGALAMFAPPPFDQTLTLAAGNYIDRTRLAQMRPPQATVAQQVMGGAPQAPASVPPGGLGVTPPAAPPMALGMAPPMGAPPMGMAGGGLSDLPIPDTMFNEPTDGGYAGGGIIAFGAGTPGTYGKFFEETALSAIPGIRVTSRKRTPEENARVGGVPNSFHQTDDARDFVPPEGMTMKQLAAALRGKFGSNFDVIDEGDHVHVEPGPKAGARSASRHFFTSPKAGARSTSSEAGARSASSEAGALDALIGAQSIIPERNLENSVSLAQRFMGPSKELLDAEDKQRARLEKMGSDEAYEEARKDSLANFMASVGFNMGASKAPGILQMFNEAAAAALPGARADKKERKALKDRALDGLVALGARDRERANEAFKVGVDIYKADIDAKQAEQLMSFRREELTSRIIQSGLDRESAEKIAGMRTSNPTQFESMMAIITGGDMNQKIALEKYLKLMKPQYGALPGDPEGANGGDANSGMTIVGSRPAA
jgi:hypothetical protein